MKHSMHVAYMQEDNTYMISFWVIESCYMSFNILLAPEDFEAFKAEVNAPYVHRKE
jgi:hypothetical protein